MILADTHGHAYVTFNPLSGILLAMLVCAFAAILATILSRYNARPFFIGLVAVLVTPGIWFLLAITDRHGGSSTEYAAIGMICALVFAGSFFALMVWASKTHRIAKACFALVIALWTVWLSHLANSSRAGWMTVTAVPLWEMMDPDYDSVALFVVKPSGGHILMRSKVVADYLYRAKPETVEAYVWWDPAMRMEQYADETHVRSIAGIRLKD